MYVRDSGDGAGKDSSMQIVNVSLASVQGTTVSVNVNLKSLSCLAYPKDALCQLI